jgi:hypothetical protein
VILGLILVPLHAHVAVDCVQALRNSAAALDVRFLNDDNFLVTSPVSGFVGGTTACHASADDENIRIDKYGFSSREQSHQTTPSLS